MLGPKIAVVGIGGAGCRIVDSMASTIQTGPFFTVVSTDIKTLATCRISSRLKIGERTDGLFGTGTDPNKGLEAAKFSYKEIKELFSDVELAFLVAGLGGGTGSGAMPFIVETAKECGAMTMAITVLPFAFEGEEKERIAGQALSKIKKVADVVVTVPNSRFVVGDETKLKETMLDATEVISNGVCGIWKTINKSTFLGFDFSDLQMLVKDNNGVCTFAFGEGNGKDKAGMAVNAMLNSPMLEGGSLLQKAPAMLISIIGGSDFTISEANHVVSAISAKAHGSARKLTGVVIDDNWRNRVTVTVMISQETDERMPDEHEVFSEDVNSAKTGKVEKPFAKTAVMQANLDLLNIMEKGRFKNIEPTYWRENNLDVPTFIRKKIAIKAD